MSAQSSRTRHNNSSQSSNSQLERRVNSARCAQSRAATTTGRATRLRFGTAEHSREHSSERRAHGRRVGAEWLSSGLSHAPALTLGRWADQPRMWPRPGQQRRNGGRSSRRQQSRPRVSHHRCHQPLAGGRLPTAATDTTELPPSSCNLRWQPRYLRRLIAAPHTHTHTHARTHRWSSGGRAVLCGDSCASYSNASDLERLWCSPSLAPSISSSPSSIPFLSDGALPDA